MACSDISNISRNQRSKIPPAVFNPLTNHSSIIRWNGPNLTKTTSLIWIGKNFLSPSFILIIPLHLNKQGRASSSNYSRLCYRQLVLDDMYGGIEPSDHSPLVPGDHPVSLSSYYPYSQTDLRGIWYQIQLRRYYQ